MQRTSSSPQSGTAAATWTALPPRRSALPITYSLHDLPVGVLGILWDHLRSSLSAVQDGTSLISTSSHLRTTCSSFIQIGRVDLSSQKQATRTLGLPIIAPIRSITFINSADILPKVEQAMMDPRMVRMFERVTSVTVKDDYACSKSDLMAVGGACPSLESLEVTIQDREAVTALAFMRKLSKLACNVPSLEHGEMEAIVRALGQFSMLELHLEFKECESPRILLAACRDAVPGSYYLGVVGAIEATEGEDVFADLLHMPNLASFRWCSEGDGLSKIGMSNVASLISCTQLRTLELLGFFENEIDVKVLAALLCMPHLQHVKMVLCSFMHEGIPIIRRDGPGLHMCVTTSNCEDMAWITQLAPGCVHQLELDWETGIVFNSNPVAETVAETDVTINLSVYTATDVTQLVAFIASIEVFKSAIPDGNMRLEIKAAQEQEQRIISGRVQEMLGHLGMEVDGTSDPPLSFTFPSNLFSLIREGRAK